MKREGQAMPPRKGQKKRRKAVLKSTTFRVKSCQFFIKGKCTKGQDCQFSHDCQQGVNSLCKYHLTNNCLKEDCMYIHDLSNYPCRYFNTVGACIKSGCPFNHKRESTSDEMMNLFLSSQQDFIRQHAQPCNPIYKFLDKRIRNFIQKNSQLEGQIPLLKKLIKELIESARVRRQSFILKTQTKTQVKQETVNERRIIRGDCSIKIPDKRQLQIAQILDFFKF